MLTFGVAYAKISPDAAALDRDTLAINGPPYPIRDDEVVFEVSLRGADRALVDRAAGSAIHRPSRRQCAESERSDGDDRQRLHRRHPQHDQILAGASESMPSRTRAEAGEQRIPILLAADADDAQEAAAAETQPLHQRRSARRRAPCPAP